MRPLIRLIVVNFNGGQMTIRCLENLLRTSWPSDRLEVVLVDNASGDGVADLVESILPTVQVIRSPVNLGFGGGANLGLRDLGSVSYVGFVNNDAFPEREWLDPLVETMESDKEVGAAAPKILLAQRFVPIQMQSPAFQPGRHDPRSLGVMIRGLRVDGNEALDRAVFKSGFHGWEEGLGGRFQWTSGDGIIWCPFDADCAVPTSVEISVAGGEGTALELVCGSSKLTHHLGTDPEWISVKVGAEPFDVINNAGSRLVSGGWAGDRGFLEPDKGQFDEQADVFAWCGAAVLLSRRYLEDLGGFEDGLFLYYEDTDLSWRGQLRGWRYRYVPESRVRHLHSATSVEGSALFSHYVDRNRLLVYLRNAPLPEVADAVWGYLAELARIGMRDLVRPTLHRRPRQTLRAKQKARSLVAFARHAPAALVHRQRQANSVGRRVVTSWAERP